MAQICNEEMGKCFGQLRDTSNNVCCEVLTVTYKEAGQCPFCKQRREWTDDIWYPYDPNYGQSIKPGSKKEVSA